MSETPGDVVGPTRRGSELTRALRHRVGSRARAIVEGALNPRFDVVEAELGQLTHRMAIVEQMLVRSELEVGALRQQVDECLDYLQLQHTTLRDVLEEVRPLLDPEAK